jgi:hypothetical protein
MIPKIIHVSWIDKNILDDDSDLVKYGLKRLVEKNPDWELQVSDDDDVDRYLTENLSAFDYALLKHKHIVEKTDVWRLIKIFKEGGIYTDIDRCFDTPISHILKENIKLVLPTCLDHDFTHDFMMSAPGNPIYSMTLNLNLSRRREGIDNVYYLGAQTYMHAVTQCLTGEMVETGPGKEKMDYFRRLMAMSGFIETYREYPPTDTVLYRSKYMSKEEHEWMKHEFYAKHGIKHWTKEW